MQGVFKVSLHASGAWRFAYKQEAHAELVEGLPGDKGRVIGQWPRPSEFAPECTLAFRIVTPPSAVTDAVHLSRDKSVQWIAKAPEGQATEIDIIIVTAGTRVSGWPGRRSMQTSLIGSLALPSGETVWVVTWAVPMPDLSKLGSIPFGRFFKGRSRRDLKRGQSLRMLAFGHENDGSRAFYDLAGIYKPSRLKLLRLDVRDFWRQILGVFSRIPLKRRPGSSSRRSASVPQQVPMLARSFAGSGSKSGTNAGSVMTTSCQESM
jgi:hypothetical protein